MPALNVDFSDDELTELRSVAQERGVTLKALVRGAVTEDLAHHRALTQAASVFRSFVDDNAAAFAAAFPDDSPGSSACRTRRTPPGPRRSHESREQGVG